MKTNNKAVKTRALQERLAETQREVAVLRLALEGVSERLDSLETSKGQNDRSNIHIYNYPPQDGYYGKISQ